MDASGDTDPVWVHTEPRLKCPYFSQLRKNLQTDVCVIGSGIAGISTAYELVTRGIHVIMVEGRELLSGESGRTGGHLSNALDSGYRRMASRHGDHGAQIAADSHSWAIRRVYDVSRRLGVECEYRQLPCYKISQYQQTDDRHQEEVRQLREEATKAKMFNLSVSFREGYAIRGWDGAPNQRDAAVYEGQTVFHPVKYMVGVLTWLKNQPNFACYTLTRVVSIEERVSRQSGKDSKHVCVYTERGYTIACNDAVEATCEPCFRQSDILAWIASLSSRASLPSQSCRSQAQVKIRPGWSGAAATRPTSSWSTSGSVGRPSSRTARQSSPTTRWRSGNHARYSSPLPRLQSWC